MRFTKIPLIATLMAVALSLLIVIPALGQTSGYDDPRGTLASGSNLRVSVLDTAGPSNDPATIDATTLVKSDDMVAESYFNGNLYVSNGENAHNTVRITATSSATNALPGADGRMGVLDDPATTGADENEQTADATDNITCGAKATVRNNRSGRSYTVYLDQDLNEDTTAEAVQTATFQIVGAGTESEVGTCASTTLGHAGATPVVDPGPAAAVVGLVPARHGDTLTITVAGVQGSINIKVDAEGPDFSEIFPEDNLYVGSQTVKFRFVVMDADSGLRHDGELDYTRGDSDARAVNLDRDQFTTDEPRSDANGAAEDIDVVFGSNGSGDGGEDQSNLGSRGWRQRGARPGVSYFLDMAITNRMEGRHYWYLEATDRAGNMTRTEADSDDRDDFRLWVDVSNPEFRDARTGVSYDTDDQKEVADRSSVAVTFEEGDGSLDAVMNIDHNKFLVEGVDVVGAIHLTDSPDCDDSPLDIDGNCLNEIDVPQSRVYLQLSEPLAPDATPVVSMFGGAALDRAGNPSNQDEVRAEDFIAPTITVTLTTAVMDRPVLRHNSEFTVTITSDEELRTLPAVWFAELDAATPAEAEKGQAPLGSSHRGDRVAPMSGQDNSWQQTYRTNDVGSADGAYAVIVIGEDDNDNVGSTPGWGNARTDRAPISGRKAKLSSLIAGNLLVEIDTNESTADPMFELSPETGEDSKKTESSNPFITIDFGAEKGEYDKSFKGDSHSAVAITAITLNGVSVADRVSSVSNNKYTVGLRDLGEDSYELKVTGTDDAGNDTTASYKFSVVPRDPYKINLVPGWNLISLPGTPLDPSVGAVMADSMQSAIVLAYQDDAWLTAVNDSGTWRGTLTDIVGGYGYWVQTTAFESISTQIPETDTSTILPTAKVIKGWNLLGVVDVQQAPTKGSTCVAPSDNSEADDYFGNFDWRVAYSFDTSNNTWSKAIKGSAADGEICNGKGYWVWSTKAGKLVP